MKKNCFAFVIVVITFVSLTGIAAELNNVKKNIAVFSDGLEALKNKELEKARDTILNYAGENPLNTEQMFQILETYGRNFDKQHILKFFTHPMVRFFREAAKSGDPQAQSNLGYIYLNGLGVKKHDKKALKLFKRSAKQKNSYGQINLGSMYERGLVIEQNYAKANRLYIRAATQGNEYGLKNLGIRNHLNSEMKNDVDASVVIESAYDAEKNLIQHFFKKMSIFKLGSENSGLVPKGLVREIFGGYILAVYKDLFIREIKATKKVFAYVPRFPLDRKKNHPHHLAGPGWLAPDSERTVWLGAFNAYDGNIKYMNWYAADAKCKELGARLPTIKEFEALTSYLGGESQLYEDEVKFIMGFESPIDAFWVSDLAPDSGSAYFWSYGKIRESAVSKKSASAARCVYNLP